MTWPQRIVIGLTAWFVLGLAALGAWNLAKFVARRSKFGRTT